MCVIVIKEKGQPFPTTEMLQACFEDNPHGAGYMFADGGKVHLKKGFMNFGSLKKELAKDREVYGLDTENVVFHFRIASAGLINPANCHPFPVSADKEDLEVLNTQCSLAFCHNGRLEGYVEGDELSDTQHFGMEVLAPLCQRDKDFHKDKYLRKMLEQLVGSQYCLCLMDGEGNLTKVGSFPTHDGYAVSNLHFSDEYRLQERKRTEKYMHLDRIKVTQDNSQLADEIYQELEHKERPEGRWSLWAWKGEIVGLSCLYHEEGNHEEAWCTYIGVREKDRRKKIGSQILEEFLASCRWNGLKSGKIRTKMSETTTAAFCLINGMTASLDGEDLIFSRHTRDEAHVLQACMED